MREIVLNYGHNRLIWRLVRENFRKNALGYAIATAAMVAVAATTALSAWIIKDVADEFFLSKDIGRIYMIAGFVAVIFVVKGAAVFVQSYVLSKVGNGIVAEQQRRMYDRVLRHGIEFYHSVPLGDLITRITHNAQAVRDVLNLLVTSAVRDLLTLIGLVAVMVIQQPLLSLVALVVAPASIYGVTLLVRKVRQLAEKEFLSLAQMVQVMQETVVGVRIVKAFNLEGLMRRRMHRAISNVEERANGIALLGSSTSPVMETLGGLAIAAVIVIGGTVVIHGGQTPGSLMSFVAAMLLAYEPAKRLARFRISLEAGMIGVRMMFELEDRPLVIAEAEPPVELAVPEGRIEFDKVGFSYREGETILDRFDLVIEPGKVTALVGPSGGGKSTIMNLILRLYDPVAGAVRIDGVDIRDVTFQSLRAHIALVSQETFLFAGTIRDNIAMGRDGATDVEIVEAARGANAHEFIMAMPKGYDTQVGENGVQLSGGQKQRLTIARALLKDARIVLLDEATSSIDSEAEMQVKKAFDVLLKGRTAVVIAHRLSTVRSADRICVVKEGRIVESGTHAALLEARGLYAELFDLQFRP